MREVVRDDRERREKGGTTVQRRDSVPVDRRMKRKGRKAWRDGATRCVNEK